MSADWPEIQLGDFIELKRGYDLPKKKRKPGTVPLVSSAGPSDFHSEAMVKGPGVVTGRYGTIGKLFFVEDDYWPLNTTLYVRDFKGNHPRFAYYLLQTVDFLQFSDKAAVPGVNRNHLHTAKIRVPVNFEEQEQIANILQTLDDKIEINRQINQTLEKMAQAIFKSWFVDFDPVNAKLQAIKDGRDPIDMAVRVIGNPALEQAGESLREIAALFPSEFEESEVGLVPMGWEPKTLGDLAKNHSARFDFDRYEKVIFVNTGDVSEGVFLHSDESEKVGLPGQAKKAIEYDDILYSEIRPKNRRYAYVNFDAAKYVVSTKFMVIRSLGQIEPRILSLILTRSITVDEINMIAESRSGTFPQITFDSISYMPILLPPMELQQQFLKILLPIVEQQEQTEKQNNTLLELRDALLPKLLSGELRVGDAEQQLTEVANA